MFNGVLKVALRVIRGGPQQFAQIKCHNERVTNGRNAHTLTVSIIIANCVHINKLSAKYYCALYP